MKPGMSMFKRQTMVSRVGWGMGLAVVAATLSVTGYAADAPAGGTPGILAYPELMALASRTLKGASLPC